LPKKVVSREFSCSRSRIVGFLFLYIFFGGEGEIASKTSVITNLGASGLMVIDRAM
jgi:hypothetical protein